MWYSKLILLIILCIAGKTAVAQVANNNIIQINGVTMTADSLRAVPGTTVLVKNMNRGVYASDKGVFSIVCHKGDTLQFTSVGFRDKEYVVPQNIEGQYFSMIQLMVQDTFYLPETIVRPYMSKEELEYAFRNSKVPDDKYEIARKNTDALTLRAISFSLPRDGRESQAIYQGAASQNAVYYGQRPAINVFDPLKWAEFFDAWKRGDFRKKF